VFYFVISGLKIIGHGNPDINLESLCIQSCQNITQEKRGDSTDSTSKLHIYENKQLPVEVMG
jgi:hypothetical protein